MIPTTHSVEDFAAAESERIPVAVDLKWVLADEGGLDDLFEVGAKDRLSLRNDPIGPRRFGPSLDAGLSPDAQEVPARLERCERDVSDLHDFL